MSRMAATRDGYGQALLDLASNEKVVVLEADLGKSTKSLHFRKAHPEPVSYTHLTLPTTLSV